VPCPDAPAHHWIIEPPAGPTSKGVCRFCGAEREFANSGAYFIDEEHKAAMTAMSAERKERKTRVLTP